MYAQALAHVAYACEYARAYAGKCMGKIYENGTYRVHVYALILTAFTYICIFITHLLYIGKHTSWISCYQNLNCVVTYAISVLHTYTHTHKRI